MSRSSAGRRQGHRRDGVVLVAALVFVALLAVVVTGQLERLPLVSAESRGAGAIAQRQLDAGSALALVVGVLRADAATNGYDWFGDIWATPHTTRVGEVEIEVRIGDTPFLREPRDEWVKQDLGIPADVRLVAVEDFEVQRLFSRVRPNVNTSPAAAVRKAMGLSADGIAWVKRRRADRPVAGPEDLRDVPGLGIAVDTEGTGGLSFSSPLFVADAVIRRPGGPPRRLYWVLRREGGAVRVVYSGAGEVAG